MIDHFRRTAMLLLALEIVGIVWLVLNPSSATPSGAVLRVSNFLLAHGAPGWMASTTGWEYLLNAVLFLPLGCLAAVIWHRVSLEAWVLVGFLVSTGLELFQLTFLDGRSATVSDVSANTLGMFAGAVLSSPVVVFMQRWERRRRRAAVV